MSRLKKFLKRENQNQTRVKLLNFYENRELLLASFTHKRDTRISHQLAAGPKNGNGLLSLILIFYIFSVLSGSGNDCGKPGSKRYARSPTSL